MRHLVPMAEIIRQQNTIDSTVPGSNWEERVAALERMQWAMKQSGWPGLGNGAVGASPAKPATDASAALVAQAAR